MKYVVAIIGAGPGGIFSAYELTKLAPRSGSPFLKPATALKSAIAPSTARRSKAASAAKAARS